VILRQTGIVFGQKVRGEGKPSETETLLNLDVH